MERTIKITGTERAASAGVSSDFARQMLTAVVLLGLVLGAWVWVWNFTGEVDAQALSIWAGR